MVIIDPSSSRTLSFQDRELGINPQAAISTTPIDTIVDLRQLIRIVAP
jgi:hypothetical protein